MAWHSGSAYQRVLTLHMLFPTRTTLAAICEYFLLVGHFSSHSCTCPHFFELHHSFTDYDMFWTGIHILEGCGGATESTNVTFQIPEIRTLTGEEQKQVCKLALRTAAKQFDIEPTKTRCYVGEQTITEAVEEDSSGRRLQTGMYDVSGMAVLNFDYTIPPNVVNVEEVQALSRAASATASGNKMEMSRVTYSLSLPLTLSLCCFI